VARKGGKGTSKEKEKRKEKRVPENVFLVTNNLKKEKKQKGGKEARLPPFKRSLGGEEKRGGREGTDFRWSFFPASRTPFSKKKGKGYRGEKKKKKGRGGGKRRRKRRKKRKKERAL